MPFYEEILYAGRGTHYENLGIDDMQKQVKEDFVFKQIVTLENIADDGTLQEIYERLSIEGKSVIFDPHKHVVSVVDRDEEDSGYYLCDYVTLAGLIIEEMLDYRTTNWNVNISYDNDGILPWNLRDSLGAIIHQYVVDFAYDEASKNLSRTRS